MRDPIPPLHIPGTLETPPMELRFRDIGRSIPTDLVTGAMIQFIVTENGQDVRRCGVVTHVKREGASVHYVVGDYEKFGKPIELEASK